MPFLKGKRDIERPASKDADHSDQHRHCRSLRGGRGDAGEAGYSMGGTSVESSQRTRPKSRSHGPMLGTQSGRMDQLSVMVIAS